MPYNLCCYTKLGSLNEENTRMPRLHVRMPATSYLVPLFTLIYKVLFTLLLPYNLDVPCYLNNRQRYCSVWPEREDSLHSKCENCVIEQMCLWLHWTLFVLLSIILPPLVSEVII